MWKSSDGGGFNDCVDDDGQDGDISVHMSVHHSCVEEIIFIFFIISVIFNSFIQ